MAERISIHSIDARRAGQIAAGSLVVVLAARALGFDELIVSAWGLREGMVLEAAHCPAPDEPRLTRRASTIDLAERCNWDEPHARHVADLALQLFDQTAPLHDLDTTHRELLEYGAFLHDIGRHIAAEDHHKHAAYLIEHGGLRAFSRDELATLICMARFHRSGEPKTSFPAFAQLGARAKAAVRSLTAILQIADGLDRSHAGAVSGVDVAVSPQRVTIGVVAPGDADVERWSAAQRGELLAAVAERPVEVVAAVPPAAVSA